MQKTPAIVLVVELKSIPLISIGKLWKLEKASVSEAANSN